MSTVYTVHKASTFYILKPFMYLYKIVLKIFRLALK